MGDHVFYVEGESPLLHVSTAPPWGAPLMVDINTLTAAAARPRAVEPLRLPSFEHWARRALPVALAAVRDPARMPDVRAYWYHATAAEGVDEWPRQCERALKLAYAIVQCEAEGAPPGHAAGLAAAV